MKKVILIFLMISCIGFAQTTEELNNELIKMVKANNIKGVEKCIKKGANVDFRSSYKRTALILASEKGYTNIAELLIKNGADVNLKGYFGDSAFIFAALNGHADIAKLLVKNHAKVGFRAKQFNWNTRLLVDSIKKGYVDIAKILIKHGADVKPDYNNNPLGMALYSGYNDVAKLLIEHGADANSSLWRAIDGKGNLDFIKFLFKYNPNIDSDYSLALAISRGKLDIAKFLIENKIGINYVNENNATPLLLAIDNNYNDISKLLIKNDANINFLMKTNYNNYTPLSLAIRNKNDEIIKILIEKGTNFSSESTNIAILTNNISILKLLIKNGADLKSIYKDINSSNYEFSSYKSIKDPLFFSIEKGYLDIAKLLIKSGVNLDYEDKYNSTPLASALKNEHIDIANLLIKSGAKKLDIEFKYSSWSTNPLEFCLSYNYFDTAKLLIENGANVKPVLNSIMEHNNTKIIKAVLKSKININTANSMFFHALNEKNFKVILMLLFYKPIIFLKYIFIFVLYSIIASIIYKSIKSVVLNLNKSIKSIVLNLNKSTKSKILNLNKSIGPVIFLIILFMYIIPIFSLKDFYHSPHSLNESFDEFFNLIFFSSIYFALVTFILRMFFIKKFHDFTNKDSNYSMKNIKPAYKKFYVFSHIFYCALNNTLIIIFIVDPNMRFIMFTLIKLLLTLYLRFINFKASINSISYSKDKLYLFKDFIKVEVFEINQIKNFEIKRITSDQNYKRKNSIHFHLITEKENFNFYLKDIFSDSDFDNFLEYLCKVTNKENCIKK